MNYLEYTEIHLIDVAADYKGEATGSSRHSREMTQDLKLFVFIE